MSRRPDILALDRERPAPVMPSACASGGCGGAEPEIPPPPSFGDVRVNGVEIPPEAIAQEIQHHPAPDAESAWIAAARALAIRELLLQEAQRLDLEVEPEVDEAGRVEPDDDALVRALLEESVQPHQPDESECRRFYEANAERFRTPDLFEASHILIEPQGEEPAAWERAHERAWTILRDLGDDPSAFAAAARAHSACASAQQDGSLGQIRRGELVPSIHQALESLEDGSTLGEPVRSRFGWHLLRLQRRIVGRSIPFEIARPKIADMLEARSWSLEAARYVARLAEQGSVEGVRIEGAAV